MFSLTHAKRIVMEVARATALVALVAGVTILVSAGIVIVLLQVLKWLA